MSASTAQPTAGPWGLSAARRRACLEAAWELDALARILPGQLPPDVAESSGPNFVVRGIADRMLRLTSLLMAGLDDKCVPTEDLESMISLDSGQG